MGRLFVHISASVDGYINDAEGGIEWWAVDEEFNRYIDAMLESIEGMFFGRVAHEELAQFWPNATAETTPPTQARRMHDLPKYVLTSGKAAADWHNTHLLGPDPAAAIGSLKRAAERDLAVFAGAGAVTSALALGVVDELRLVVHPALVGGGNRLFGATYPPNGLRLIESRPFGSGAIALRYDLSG